MGHQCVHLPISLLGRFSYDNFDGTSPWAGRRLKQCTNMFVRVSPHAGAVEILLGIKMGGFIHPKPFCDRSLPPSSSPDSPDRIGRTKTPDNCGDWQLRSVRISDEFPKENSQAIAHANFGRTATPDNFPRGIYGQMHTTMSVLKISVLKKDSRNPPAPPVAREVPLPQPNDSVVTRGCQRRPRDVGCRGL